jgi:uncharacterized membrane protein YfhO
MILKVHSTLNDIFTIANYDSKPFNCSPLIMLNLSPIMHCVLGL